MNIYIPGVKPRTRRIQRLSIELGLLLEMFRSFDGTKALITTSHIPDDAKIVGCSIDRIVNTVDLYVESEEYPELSEGSVYPSMTLNVSLWHLSERELQEKQEYLEVQAASVFRSKAKLPTISEHRG